MLQSQGLYTVKYIRSWQYLNRHFDIMAINWLKNIQDDTEMLPIICGPFTGVHHGLYTGYHGGVKRFQDIRSNPV